MKSLLLILTLVSFTVYKAEMNEKLRDNSLQPLIRPALLNGSNETAIAASLIIDSTKTTAIEKQFKNKS
jgi:hypothetical protein